MVEIKKDLCHFNLKNIMINEFLLTPKDWAVCYFEGKDCFYYYSHANLEDSKVEIRYIYGYKFKRFFKG
jgi:hypothetical protein